MAAHDALTLTEVADRLALRELFDAYDHGVSLAGPIVGSDSVLQG
jgi:hypothetical protein